MCLLDYRGNVLSRSMVASMNAQPIVFALANPEPEINYEDAMAARKDLIFATGRSDYPNQVNNAIGFPFIFRGALDVRATQINEAMKLAAVYAIAELAKETVPEIVNIAYNKKNLSFGREYYSQAPRPAINFYCGSCSCKSRNKIGCGTNANCQLGAICRRARCSHWPR